MRNKICQKQFKEFATNTNRFTKCFSSSESFDIQFKRWHRQFQKSIHANFRKNRHKMDDTSNISNVDFLMNKKKDILKKKKKSPIDIEDIELLYNEINKECEEMEWKKLNTIIGSLDSPNTNTNIWKQMRKAFPKKVKPLPTGVKDIENKVITNPEEKKKVIIDHFKHRMRQRPAMKNVEEVLDINKKLFQERLKNARNVKSMPFTLEELGITLKNLKVGKSRDPENLVTEIFKEDAIGDDLKQSLVDMMNKMKEQLVIPECMRTANITMLHKKKCKSDLKNWRGIFVTSVLRTILMKMLHERSYEIVASNMTDAQIGARKKKSVRNHLFILNSIMSDVLSSKKKKSIDLNVMDFSHMFDAEDVSICLNSLYEAGVKDDTLVMIYEANKTNVISVKTPNGITDKRTIHEKIMQGDVLSPLVTEI